MTEPLRSFAQFLCLSILLTVCTTVISAQSSIFFVPSTDTQEKKTFYLGLESFAHFDKYERGGFQSYGPSIIYGVRKNLEIGVNFYYTREQGAGGFELQPTIKWKAYENKKGDVAVAVGTVVFIPLNAAAGNRPSAMLYANASKSFESANGLRLTGGAYQMVGADPNSGTKTGVMAGLEQPLTKKLTLLADWASGDNRLGYSNLGFGYEVNKSQYLAIGYTFGNKGRGNNFLSAFYGFTF